MIKLIISLIIIVLIDRLAITHIIFLPVMSIVLLNIPPKTAFKWALFSGVFYDALLAHRLGISSLLLLSILLQYHLFQTRFDLKKTSSIIVLSTIASIETHIFLGLHWSASSIISFILICLLVWYFVKKTGGSSQSADIFLKS